MTPEEKQTITFQISQLNSEYWHQVDRLKGAAAHELFTKDGVYTTSLSSRTGWAAISAFYQGRQERPMPRTGRHIISNERIVVVDANHVTVDWILQLHAADGDPVLPSKSALLIGDVHDICVRAEDGRWRYKSRTITPIFKGDAPTTG